MTSVEIQQVNFSIWRVHPTKVLLFSGAICCLFCNTKISADTPPPNILFAISDDQSWMHAGAYGDRATATPAFDQVAREGVLFQRAFAAAPSCAPSRSALLLGRNIWEIGEAGVLFGVLRPISPAFTQLLRKAGYQLGSTGKTWGPGRITGWQRREGQQDSSSPSSTELLFGKRYDQRQQSQPQPGINPNDYAANFAEFLRERNPSQPFFFWYGATEPHQRYNEGAWEKAGKQLQDARLPGCLPDHPITRGEILDYGLEIEHFDRHLGRMLQMLKDAGELDNTLVVVTSDHGNPLPRSKCNLYDSGTRVPLAIRLPGVIPSGRQVNDFVNLIDLAPTLIDAAQAKVPGEMSGKSLWSILTSDQSGQIDPERKFVVTAMERHIISRRGYVGYPMRCLRTSEFSYIRNAEPDRWPAGDPDYFSIHQGFYGDCDRGASKRFLLQNAERPEVRPFFQLAFGRRPAEELYDMRQDPHQLKNLAQNSQFAEIKLKLATQLNEYLRQHDDPRQRGEAPWDNYRFADERVYSNENP